jgi:hypothetical protein
MSNVSMMAGFIVKIADKVDQERYEKLVEDFDIDKLNEWQPFYDYDGFECLVFLTESEHLFNDDLSTSVNIPQIQAASASFNKYLDDAGNNITQDKMNHFVKIWYNGTDMGSCFQYGEKQ